MGRTIRIFAFCVLVALAIHTVHAKKARKRSQASPNEHKKGPKGHMLPLGGWMDEYDPVDEVDSITPHDFWTKYVIPWKPLVIRGAAKTMPAFAKWTEEYFRKKWSHLEVRVERKIENRNDPTFEPFITSLDDFLNRFRSEPLYTVSVLPHDLARDVDVLPSMLCGDRDQSHSPEQSGKRWLTLIEELGFWIGINKTQSQLHYDEPNIMNCLFSGEKEWKFISTANYSKQVRLEQKAFKVGRWPPATSSSDYSTVNVSHVDMIDNPNWKDVRVMRTVQRAGDCVFIPYAHLHQVTKHTHAYSTAATIMWRRQEKYSEEACQDAPNTYLPLSAFDTMWYYAGKGPVPMGYPDPVEFRNDMYELATKVAKKNEGQRRRACAKLFYESMRGWIEGKNKKRTKKLTKKWLKKLDPLGQGYITKEGLDTLDMGTFAQAVVDIDYDHPVPGQTYFKKPEAEIKLGRQQINSLYEQWKAKGSKPASTVMAGHSEL